MIFFSTSHPSRPAAGRDQVGRVDVKSVALSETTRGLDDGVASRQNGSSFTPTTTPNHGRY